MRIASNRFSPAVLGVALGAALTSGLIIASLAQGKTKPAPEPKCNITPVKAIEIAQAKVKGRALQANFELDGGQWVYGVMIVHGKTISEVEIDPLTGKVADVETVTPDGEAKELKSQLTRAVGGRAARPERGEQDEKGEKE